ncbi:MAG TPA: glycosyltransferase family 2 protein [Candidatus Bipolaricaulota bacterium]|nr:glycosyltransferase family 2 protein [Candidatus Bipolaricaulota bacterium]
MSKVIIVLPAYNEEKTIAAVIEDLLRADFQEIVAIDDGSSDNTLEVLKKYPVHCLAHKINCGQGASLRTGTEMALALGADIIVHFDADGQHQVKDIEKFVEAIESGHDIAIGSRFFGENQNIPFTKKWFILKPGILFNWFFTGLKLTDAHNGFRAMSRLAAQKIKITQNRMAHNTEIPSEIFRHGLKYAEVPVEIIYKEYGQTFRGGINIIVDLIKHKMFH